MTDTIQRPAQGETEDRGNEILFVHGGKDRIISNLMLLVAYSRNKYGNFTCIEFLHCHGRKWYH